MISVKPRKQRKELFDAPLHKKRKWLASHLDENLLLKYDRRAIPVIKGDTVRVLRGSYKGHEDRVVRLNVSKRYVEVEGLTMTKADGKKIAKPIHASDLLITKLNLTDKWRRQKLERGLSEETKKEIEKEAEEQIREIEEEQISKEEEEKEKEIEEGKVDEEEEIKEPVKKTEETEKKIVKPKKKKKEKPKESKTKAKKKTVKKTPAKKTMKTKKEEK